MAGCSVCARACYRAVYDGSGRIGTVTLGEAFRNLKEVVGPAVIIRVD